MPDAYLSSGYKSERARQQAAGFQSGPRESFMAPPGTPPIFVPPGGSPPPGLVPVPPWRPPPIPKPTPFALGATSAIFAGLGLGYEVSRDAIWPFKEKAWRPFYDTEGPYYPSKIRFGPYTDETWQRAIPEFDPYEDYWIRWRHDRLIKEAEPFWIGRDHAVPAGFWSPDMRHGIVRTRNGIRHWFRYVHTCPGNPAANLFDEDGPSTCTTPGWGNNNGWASNGTGFCGTLGGTSGWQDRSAPSFTCPANETSFALLVGGYTRVGAGTVKLKEAWLHEAAPVGQVDLPANLDYGTELKPAAVPLEDYQLGHATTVEEGEPSLEEQLAAEVLPRGKTRRGFVVPFSLSAPFTRIIVSPGSPPVTVPDQEIDPGSETDPGGVTILPPSQPPGNPTDDEAREQKPWPQRLAHMGFVAIDVVTEGMDFIEAMHQGLPKRYRSKGRKGGKVPPWVILEDIWDHWDHWDSDVALDAFVNNQIEDAIYGMYFRQTARVQRNLGGIGRVRGARQSHIITLPVPEVHFANGQFNLSVGDWEVGW